MDYTRDLPEDSSQEVIDQVVEHVRAELSARADADDDPTTRAEDVQVRVERQDGRIRVIGELDAEPDAPYLREDFDAFADVPDELRAHARDDFDSGDYLPPGGSTVSNKTGRPEPVLNSEQWNTLRSTTGEV